MYEEDPHPRMAWDGLLRHSMRLALTERAHVTQPRRELASTQVGRKHIVGARAADERCVTARCDGRDAMVSAG